jgi:GT2 family glycosyltransferase
VSLSLVTYNAMRWLDACLASALAQTHPAVEILVLDNASTDGTVARLLSFSKDHSSIRVAQSAQNLGFAAAQNRNLEMVRGAFVCLLNQDVILDVNFLTEAVGAFEKDAGTAAIQGKLYRLGPKLEKTAVFDTTGLQILRNRRIISRGQGQVDTRQYDRPEPIFGADGPAPVFRLAALRDVKVPRTRGGWEILDEDFFMYKEDADLAWRLLLFGWNAVYVPTAVAWHARGAGASAQSVLALARERRRVPAWIRCRSWANQRLMQVKNEQTSLFARDLARIMWKEARALGYLIVFETRCLSAIPRLARLIPAARRKRAYIMKHKRRGTTEMASWL